MSPALGPRRVLCVVVVTTSQWSKGLGITCDECVIVIYVCDCVSALCECVLCDCAGACMIVRVGVC